LKPSLDYAKTIAAALQRVAVYWQSRVAHDELLLPISEAWLYGINAPMRGIAEHLSQTSRISSAVADLRPALGGEGKVPPILRNDSLHFATVIGLALRAASLNVL
ncbi:MAG TPA: hypothetical protein VF803_01420, partial [Candidatus Paceibacterota bacterium]